MKLRVLVSILLVFLATVAAQGAPAPFIIIMERSPLIPAVEVGNYDGIKNIAVLSAIGTGVILQNHHFLSWKKKQLNIDDWMVDEQVSSDLRKYLAGRFTLKEVAYNRAALAGLPAGRWKETDPAIRKFMSTIPIDDLDAVVVVRPNSPGSMSVFAGLALDHFDSSDLPPMMSAHYDVDIINAHTFKVISHAESRLTFGPKLVVGYPRTFTEKELKLGPDLTPTDSQRDMLRADLFALIPLSLAESIRALELQADLPPPGTLKFWANAADIDFEDAETQVKRLRSPN